MDPMFTLDIDHCGNVSGQVCPVTGQSNLRNSQGARCELCGNLLSEPSFPDPLSLPPTAEINYSSSQLVASNLRTNHNSISKDSTSSFNANFLHDACPSRIVSSTLASTAVHSEAGGGNLGYDHDMMHSAQENAERTTFFAHYEATMYVLH